MSSDNLHFPASDWWAAEACPVWRLEEDRIVAQKPVRCLILDESKLFSFLQIRLRPCPCCLFVVNMCCCCMRQAVFAFAQALDRWRWWGGRGIFTQFTDSSALTRRVVKLVHGEREHAVGPVGRAPSERATPVKWKISARLAWIKCDNFEGGQVNCANSEHNPHCWILGQSAEWTPAVDSLITQQGKLYFAVFLNISRRSEHVE